MGGMTAQKPPPAVVRTASRAAGLRRAECAAAVEQSRARLAEYPDLVSEHWTRYAVAPDQVEFWQADKDREHTRVLYRRTPDGWARELLWP